MTTQALAAFLGRIGFSLTPIEGGVTTSPAPSPVMQAQLDAHQEELRAFLEAGGTAAAAAAEAAEAEAAEAARAAQAPILVDAFDTLALLRHCRLRAIVTDGLWDPPMPQEITDAESRMPSVRVEGPQDRLDAFAAANGPAMLKATEMELMAILQCGLVDFTDQGALASVFSAKHPLPAETAAPTES